MIDISNDPKTGLKRKVEFTEAHFSLSDIVIDVRVHYFNAQDQPLNTIIAPIVDRLVANNTTAVYTDTGQIVDVENIDAQRTTIGEFDYYMTLLPIGIFQTLQELRDTMVANIVGIMDIRNRFDK